ncbi:MAG TPA: metal ABC transporter ATP-binding protein [Thermoanaerobaculia bacterium]|jgi:zinc transport system ATP-binding protein|nr:metal ABC transporter ATP-binding protein [Thermoanaerobaculia bacterium]
MPPLLHLANVSVRLDGRDIVRNVSCDVEEGESVAIFGPNGSGKTILLKSILGIVPHDGDIRWERDATIGYVPQKIDADRTLPLVIRDLFDSKIKVTGRGRDEVAAVIANVGLTDDIVQAPIGTLSGGQFQRVMIAFALLGRPDIVFFDEPTASIDEPGEERMYELIHRLQSERGMAVVVVSHDPAFVRRYANRVLCLNHTVTYYGPPRDHFA